MDSKKDLLMEEAKSLGLKPHHSTGELKLQQMINDELTKGEDVGDVGEVETKVEVEAVAETKGERIKRLRDEQRKLVRVVVRCNNDDKKEWTGQTITVICAAGTLKKWVPFDNENGWHVPQGILDVMGAKMCQKFKNGKLANGQPHKVSFMAKEYSIEELKPLSKKELKDLEKEQAARGSID